MPEKWNLQFLNTYDDILKYCLLSREEQIKQDTLRLEKLNLKNLELFFLQNNYSVDCFYSSTNQLLH